MSYLYLVRHGQTTSNTIHALDTALPGADLTELGREQALAVGEELARRTTRPLHVMSSLAARAQQTAVLLAEGFTTAGGELASAGDGSEFASRFAGRGLSPISDATSTDFGFGQTDYISTIDDIVEIAAGDYEMRNDEDAHEAYHGVLMGWLHGETDVPVAGGKTGEEILETYVPQIISVLRALPADTDVAVVSHGAIIRFVARFLGGVDPEWAYSGYLANTHYVMLEVPEEIEKMATELSGSAVEGAFDVLEWGTTGRPDRAR
ncbi:histidine phosphatase family protein [Corynebacterium suicordis]